MTEEQIKAIELFAERVKKYYKNYRGSVASGMVVYFIEQAVKEFKDVQLQDSM
jgi:hypothetical protein